MQMKHIYRLSSPSSPPPEENIMLSALKASRLFFPANGMGDLLVKATGRKVSGQTRNGNPSSRWHFSRRKCSVSRRVSDCVSITQPFHKTSVHFLWGSGCRASVEMRSSELVSYHRRQTLQYEGEQSTGRGGHDGSCWAVPLDAGVFWDFILKYVLNSGFPFPSPAALWLFECFVSKGAFPLSLV